MISQRQERKLETREKKFKQALFTLQRAIATQIEAIAYSPSSRIDPDESLTWLCQAFIQEYRILTKTIKSQNDNSEENGNVGENDNAEDGDGNEEIEGETDA